MRIIGGRFRGMKLATPGGGRTRPSSDRLRESLFNILEHRPASPLPGARVLDLFAGSGALGLEALSRGASHLTATDNSSPALAALKANITRLGVGDLCITRRLDARGGGWRELGPFDLIFLDPPYDSGLIEPALGVIVDHAVLTAGGLMVIETGARQALSLPEPCSPVVDRHHGKTRVIIVSI